MKVLRRPALGALSGVLLAAVLIAGPQRPAAAAGPRVDLRVHVVTDGGASVSAVARQLETEGVPHTTVDLRDSGRPTIDAGFLSDTVDGVQRAKYQAVVLPNAAPFQDQAEMTAIAGYEAQFGIRQLDAYAYPSEAVGLNPPGYSGDLDGVTAEVTDAARGDALRYLRGPVRFDDAAADVGESYGFVSSPLPDDPATGRTFTPYLNATVKGATGTIAGVYTHDGRSEMVLTYSANSEQWQSRTVGHGLVTWLTKGVHLGYSRSYLGVHVDDVFLPDSRWSTEDNCTPEEDCPPDVTTPDIRMTAEDVAFAAQWQAKQGLPLDLAFNAAGSDEATQRDGEDPLTDALLGAKDQFRWVNHTYGHAFLGCEQDQSVRPWVCVEDPATGGPVYVPQGDIEQEITKNLDWASQRGLTLDKGEVVTGEHSGLRIKPQQPDDNPNLAPALAETGVTWLAGDASREPAPREVGPARTVPRHPMNVFYNVGTEAEEVDEYNWLYTRRSDGGSGICEDHPDTTTCITPLDPDGGYGAAIVPTEARIALSHVTGNDPRPHYAHQSNVTEDRILYPLLDRVLADYRAAFADNAPVVTESMTAAGGELRRQDAWKKAQDDVTAYVQDGTVTVKAPAGVDVPVTAPDGTTEGGDAFGQSYAGERSAYRTGDVTLTVPGA